MNKKLKLVVKNSGLLALKFFKDLPDGNLFIAEAREQVPFDIKRVYFINTLANQKAIRGKHAHRELQQGIFCISGSFTLHLDDGKRNNAFCSTIPRAACCSARCSGTRCLHFRTIA